MLIRTTLNQGARWFFGAVALVWFLHAAAGTVAAPQTDDTEWSAREARFEKFIDFRSLVVGGTVTPHWLTDGNRFCYVSEQPEGTVFFIIDSGTGTQEPLFDTDRLRDALAGRLGHEASAQGVPFDDFEFVDGENGVTFVVEDRTFELDLATYAITETTSGPKEDDPSNDTDPSPAADFDLAETPSPGGKWIVVTKDDNLWVRSSEDDEPTQLTTDGEPDFDWSAGEAVWSADDNRFVTHRYDVRNVHKMPVVKWLPDQEEVAWDPYPFARGPRYQEELNIVDVAAKTIVRIDTGAEPDQSYVPLAWRSEDAEFLFLRFNRGMKQLDLMAANPATGAIRTIVTDKQDTYIEGLHLYRTYDCFHYALDDDDRFVWRSERDGWSHFYLYRYDGTLVRRLTEGEFEVHKVQAADTEAGWIYFTAQGDPEHPYARHLYRVNMQGEQMTQLTEGHGRHDVSIGPNMTGFVDSHSAFDRPPAAELRRMDGTLLRTLAEADISALEVMGWKPPEEFVVKAANGVTDIYGMMYKPHDFDPARKYPLIEIIYAGSQMPAIPRTFVPSEYGHFAQILAQLNFVTVVIDARDTSERGKAFQDVVYRSIGVNEIPDHVAALRQLAAERPYIDMERVGVHGKSWGGYFALRAMLQAPEVYHVGVASAIVADLATTAYSPIAPYMESPEENPEGYDFASNLKMADALQGRLLITIATADLNTPFAQTMRMVEAFIKAEKSIDMMVFPDQHHWLQGASLDYFYAMLRNYFVEHLRPEGSR